MEEEYVLKLRRGHIVYISGDVDTMQMVKRTMLTLRDHRLRYIRRNFDL